MSKYNHPDKCSDRESEYRRRIWKIMCVETLRTRICFHQKYTKKNGTPCMGYCKSKFHELNKLCEIISKRYMENE